MGNILIVARNNVHLTKQTLKTALAQDIPCSVLLIDNASTDGTPAWTSSLRHERLNVVTLMQQKSLAACWNLGLGMVYGRGNPHALVLNNDVEIRPDTYRHLSMHRNWFVTAVSVNRRDQLNVSIDKIAVHKTCRPHPDFSCFLIYKEVWDKVRPDESYFPAYLEDNDMHVRMHRAGIEACCVDLPFLHHGAATLKQADPAERAKIERGAQQNRERFRQSYGCYPGTPEYEALFRSL